jgi:hypothetical protein
MLADLGPSGGDATRLPAYRVGDFARHRAGTLPRLPRRHAAKSQRHLIDVNAA